MIIEIKRSLQDRFFLGRFRDPIRVPRIRECYHRVPKIREIGSLQIHTRFLTFSLKKTAPRQRSRVNFSTREIQI